MNADRAAEIEKKARKMMDAFDAWTGRIASLRVSPLAVHDAADALRSALSSLPAPVEPRQEAVASRQDGDALKCADCGLLYGDPAWADIVVPDEMWARIAPEGGVLCFTCMNRRAVAKGITCAAKITSGAFCCHPASPRDEATVEEVALVIHQHAVISDADSHNAARAVLSRLAPRDEEAVVLLRRVAKGGCDWDCSRSPGHPGLDGVLDTIDAVRVYLARIDAHLRAKEDARG